MADLLRPAGAGLGEAGAARLDDQLIAQPTGRAENPLVVLTAPVLLAAGSTSVSRLAAGQPSVSRSPPGWR